MLRMLSILALLACFSLAGAVGAAERRLPAKHAKAGLKCIICHQVENPDQRPASNETCMNCHGDLPAMAAYTSKLAVNPHDPPKGPHPAAPPCADCHGQHKPPVVVCLQCHPQFKMSLS